MALADKLKDKTLRVGVVGQGYVGLSLAVEFAKKGFPTAGFDVNPARIESLRRGRSYVLDVPSAELKRLTASGLFVPSRDFKGLADCDVVLICVQTPLRKTREPDISHIVSATEAIASRLKRGALVILESTTFPGATEEIVLPILQAGGRRLGRDFFLAFSPERVDPGNSRFTIANTPKVVGGVDLASTRLARDVYAEIVDEVVPVSGARAAEMAKLLENSFRAVNIALVNEMARICRRLGLDVWEVIRAAASKPFGFMPFYPGPGIGGHCIPKDPQLLSWKMKTLDFEARLLELASSINAGMPQYAAERIAELLNKDRKPLKGSRVLVLGVAYKPDTSDFRESPSLDVMQLLLDAGAKVSYHDPFVPSISIGNRALKSTPLTEAALRSCDLAAVLTAHNNVDYPKVLKAARRVFDARNAIRDRSAANVEKL